MAKSNKVIVKSNKWKTTTSRFVCFIDIMGFKDLVSRSSHLEVFNLMSKLADEKKVLETAFNNGVKKEYKDILYTTTFSDSIIFFTKDGSKYSEIAIMIAITYLMEQAMSMGIPVKGAIAFGEMSVDKAEQIFFGQPLIDAYLLQEDVFYYGVVVHNTAEQKFTKLANKRYFQDVSTPLKSGNISHYNLNWFSQLINGRQTNYTLKKKFDNLVKKHRNITSGRPRRYLDNTIQVFNLINKE